MPPMSAAVLLLSAGVLNGTVKLDVVVVVFVIVAIVVECVDTVSGNVNVEKLLVDGVPQVRVKHAH